MSENGYLKRQKEDRQAVLDAGEQLGTQKMWDYVQIALTDPEFMKNKTLTREGIEKLFRYVHNLADTFHVAFTDDVEADYYQEKMDARLREKWGPDLVPFHERYPMLKRPGYNKARKGWK